MITTACVDRIEAESFASGACDDLTRHRIEKHLATCEACRTQIHALLNEKKEFVAQNPFEQTITIPPSLRTQRKPIPYTYAIAASLIAVLGIGIYLSKLTPRDDYRTKGATQVQLFVRSGDGSIQTRESNIYYPGERIQFSYSCATESYLCLLSIDENGRISTFFPPLGDAALKVEAGQNVPLPNSIVLDDYIGKELYVVVLAKLPFMAPDIANRLQESFRESPDLKKLKIDVGKDALVQKILLTKVPLNK